MTTLPDFILARIAEDERAARAATAGPWLTHEMSSIFVGNQADGRTSGLWEIVHMSADDLTDLTPEAASQHRADAAHIARHDPVRVLAECEAKRRIVALHDNRCPNCGAGRRCIPHDVSAGEPSVRYCDPVDWLTLTALALPYADHEDWREEWGV